MYQRENTFVSIRIPRVLHTALRNIATREANSIATVIRRLIVSEIERDRYKTEKDREP